MMIFHKRYLIPVWSSRVVSAVITFIITIPMLSNNLPCSETSSEAIFLCILDTNPLTYMHFLGLWLFQDHETMEKDFDH